MEKRDDRFDLTKAHGANLKILKEIDRICRKYKIQYMLDAGTLLGAIRHQGFIPWDDDADVAFTRKNYEAFLKVVRRELPDTMGLLMPWDFQKGRAFFDFTARIYYKNSRIHEDSLETQYYEGKMNHLWVDLFTIDVLPQGKANAALTLLLHKMVYGMAMGHRYRLDFKKYSAFHKLAVGGLSAVGRLVPMRVLFWLQRMVALKDRRCQSSLRYYSNYQPDYLYVTLQKDWCEQVEDMVFCDTKLMVPRNWHEVLTWIYGDYMKLPPKEQRVPGHSTAQIEIYGDSSLGIQDENL
ncbi:lipopolysaccharide cholinephosphotransferase [Clostridiaceae bacterium]|nr:lipopolysaccharide cholinephosphotransferase [Clostridiaceae bacterium]RKI14709.1 lipopolysaccharide cholinephosphotransferase [bacterium 1XD21-70]